MSVNYFIKDTKIKNVTKSLFDVKTTPTRYGKDIDINSLGTVDRIVGLDKLKQQVEKSILVKKGSYESAPTFGTDLLSGTRQDLSFVSKEIKDSMSTYSTLQQGQAPQDEENILGRNIYRTVDIDNIDSWEKLNSTVVPINSYVDSTLRKNTIYYYATTSVYKDTSNRVKETQISAYKRIILPSNNTLNAVVDENFIVVAENSRVILYWNLPVNVSLEEQLRSILSIKANRLLSDPRGIQVNVSVTNRDLTESQLRLISR